LTSDLPFNDLWQQVESHLATYLRKHPEVERRVMGSPVDELAPAYLFYWALVLEERVEYETAGAVHSVALPQIIDAWTLEAAGCL
jgi:hypothetical protein